MTQMFENVFQRAVASAALVTTLMCTRRWLPATSTATGVQI